MNTPDDFAEDPNPTLTKPLDIDAAEDEFEKLPEQIKHSFFQSVWNITFKQSVEDVYKLTHKLWRDIWGFGREKEEIIGDQKVKLKYVIGSHIGLFNVKGGEEIKTPAEAQYNATKVLFNFAGLRNGAKAVFFGGGIGGSERQAALEYENVEVVGVENSPDQFQSCMELHNEMRKDKNFSKGSSVRYKFGDVQNINDLKSNDSDEAGLEGSDFVIAQEMVLHTNLEEVARNAFYLLKEGGVFAGTNPFFLDNMSGIGKFLLQKGFVSTFYSPEVIAETLIEAGFVDVELLDLTEEMRPLMPLVQNLLRTSGEMRQILKESFSPAGRFSVKAFWGGIVNVYKGVGYVAFKATKPYSAFEEA